MKILRKNKKSNLVNPFLSNTPEVSGETPKKKFRILKLIIFLQFILILGLAGLSAYFYFIRVQTIQQEKNQITQVPLPGKSKDEVEAITLSQVDKQPRPSSELTVGDFLTNDSQLDLINYKSQSPIILKVNSDLSLQDTSSSSLKNIISALKRQSIEVTPVIQTDIDITGDKTKLINNIVDYLKSNNFTRIEISYSFVIRTDDYNGFIKDLGAQLQKNYIELVVSLLPKWGNDVDYNYYANYTPFYSKNVDLASLDKYVQEVRIYAFNYTTPNSILVGQIAPLDWIEKVIQYHIYSGISRQKIVLILNSNGYAWSDRDIAEDFHQNHVLTSLEATVYSQNQIADLLKNNSFTPMEEKTWNDKAVKININGSESILVYPDQNTIKNTKDLAAEYGLKGIIIY